MNVLLVEDETLVAMMIIDMLERMGCQEVWHAANRQLALDILETRQPDLGLLDLNIHGETSFNLAEILRERGIPIIFATGYGSSSLPDEWAATPFINKPFSTTLLERVLAQALDDRA